jgi:hypothetical protein
MNRAPRRASLRRASGIVAVLSLVWTAWLWLFGGFSIAVFGVVIRSNAPLRPLALGVVAMAIFLAAGGRSTITRWLAAARAYLAGPRGARFVRSAHDAAAVALAVSLFALGLVYGSTAAGGSDSYGYLSQAELWLDGQSSIEQAWVKEVPWPNAVWGFAPLGYTPARPLRFVLWGYSPPEQDRWAIVPTYSSGLPILMALGKLAGGVCGPFMIVPLAGAVLALSTYLIGARLGSRTVGLLAALLVAVSPPFLLMDFVNMSDVPVAGAFALACWCMLGTTIRSAVGGASAFAVALLIRPNLAPIVPILAVWLGWRVAARQTERWRHLWRAVIVLGGIGAALAATSAIYWVTYGTPFESGYGNTAEYFSLSHIVPNARNYAQWFTEVHTPLGFLGLAALALPIQAIWPAAVERSAVAAFALITGVVIAEFLVYLVLDNSSYLRFFLVCYPFIMLGLASLAMSIARVHSIVGPLVAAALLITVAARSVSLIPTWNILIHSRIEAAFADVAEHVRRMTPDNSVVLAMNHSGSLRYYAGRVTLRWDNLQADWLDRAVAWMAERGVHTYALVDDFELPEVVRRFEGQKLVATLERPPVFRYGNKVFFDLGLPPDTPIKTIELPVIDRPPRCWVPADPPQLVWKH